MPDNLEEADVRDCVVRLRICHRTSDIKLAEILTVRRPGAVYCYYVSIECSRTVDRGTKQVGDENEAKRRMG